MREIELLAPARDLECGLEAVRHGADAVYIGAPRFGARAAAGNSIEDIAELVRYAHTFGVRIYVTINTLLHDNELEEVDRLINGLAAIHVDALITQDPRIKMKDERVEISHPLSSFISSPLPLHSSTQMDNRTSADVQARLDAGYEQTVLARELSLDEIRAIHEAVPAMRLEAFVHGALCVCYSGRCYASEHCFGRSANRGECAQFCRLPFDLLDADGKVVTVPSVFPDGLRQRHLLSLRDMNRSADLEAMMDAGISSFKIEGRLKDVTYVKNTVAYYRQRIDAILARRSNDYCRSSYGTSTFTFTPDVNKSFNRRFTDYFLHGRTSDMACFTTPKAIGEAVGSVKAVQMPALAVAGTARFSNGDGLCFFDADNRLQGFRVNRVDDHGFLYPADPSILSQLRKGTPLFRNYDAAFERPLSRPSADRRIAVSWLIEDTTDGFRLSLMRKMKDERFKMRDSQAEPSLIFQLPHELARTPQADNIRRQLSRLGDTPYSTTDADITIRFSDNWFIPSSVLADWRRQVCDASLLTHHEREEAVSITNSNTDTCSVHSTPLPMTESQEGGPIMSCRFCLRHALGACKRDVHGLSLREPLALRLSDGRTFPLVFDCQRCEMLVLSEKL